MPRRSAHGAVLLYEQLRRDWIVFGGRFDSCWYSFSRKATEPEQLPELLHIWNWFSSPRLLVQEKSDEFIEDIAGGLTEEERRRLSGAEMFLIRRESEWGM